MSNEEHRVGVSEANLVARHLKLSLTDRASVVLAMSDIDQLIGLDAVSYDERSHILNFAYDASRLCVDDIVEVLKQHDVEVGHDW